MPSLLQYCDTFTVTIPNKDVNDFFLTSYPIYILLINSPSLTVYLNWRDDYWRKETLHANEGAKIHWICARFSVNNMNNNGQDKATWKSEDR